MNSAEQQMYEHGQADGKMFRERATKGQIARLRDLHEMNDPSFPWEAWFVYEGSHETVGEHLFFLMTPQHAEDHDAAESFWRDFDQADPLDADYVRGFAEGALGLE